MLLEGAVSWKHQPQPYSVAAGFALGLGALFAMFILLFSKILQDPARACESELLTAGILKCISVNSGNHSSNDLPPSLFFQHTVK